jgi:hypothetical protein
MRSFLLALFFVLAACTSSNHDNSSDGSANGSGSGSGSGSGQGSDAGPTQTPPPPPSMKIDLPDIGGDCMNLEKYFGRLRSLPTTVSARKLTTDMSFRATGNNIPRNFLLRLAAGNFQIQDATLAEIPEIVETRQEACTKVVMKTDGGDSTYNIIRAKPDSLTLENEWKTQMTVTWKGSNKMQIEMVSNVGDFLCDPNSRGRLQTVSEITWGNPDIFTQALADDAVDPAYLKQVIDATGYPTSVYAENNQLSVNRLKELHSWPVRTELLQCY